MRAMPSTSVTMRAVLRNIREGRPLAWGMLRRRIPTKGIDVTLDSLEYRGLVDEHHKITPAGVRLLNKYETNPK